jgi:hypothetical protein
MAHFMPEWLLPFGEAFEEALSQLTDCDALARRIDELADCIAARIDDETFTDEDLRAADDKLQALFAEYDQAKRGIDDRVRMAILTRQLVVHSLNPVSGQWEPLLDVEEWAHLGLDSTIDTYPDDVFSPAPNTEGQPIGLKRLAWGAWLKDQGPRADRAAENTGSKARKRGPPPDLLEQVKATMRAEIQEGKRTLADLKRLPTKLLTSSYPPAGITTILAARGAVLSELSELSEFVGRKNSDKQR